MTFILGIRRENKNKWEARVPIIPEDAKKLQEEYDIKILIQPSKIRFFSDKEYKAVGATITENLSACPFIFAIKEIPLDLIKSNTTYVFFSHTIKGQKKNMPMLRRLMELKCNLIDYEKIADEHGRRLVFFGRYAGIAGMGDSLWALGQRFSSQNIDTPLNEMKQTIEYGTLSNMEKHLSEIAKKIKQKGFHPSISPVVIGIAGYGNVSNGAQEILDLFPVETIPPNKLGTISSHASNHCIYKVVFTEEDMVKHNLHKDAFNLQEYYKYPEKYHSVFHTYVPHLTALINCIYWDERYPRLISKEFITHNYAPSFKLQVIGDISVDINGAIEITEKITTPDNPCFIYHPPTDSITDGLFGEGIAVLAIDNLPCELPGESSHMFSETILEFIPSIVNADFRTNFQKCNLPPEIKRAVILYHGKLTPDYQYIDRFL